ncbi:MAG: Gfo/Idh/MocA family oxidoreductase, partial [Rhodothermales bacterium]|nr:Gfo/Idh/MocA family oxidoreductase [Rhodothermales bacterium]
MPLTRKLRYGMVGGGPGAFIGEVHRKAARLDGLAELVAGVFSSNAERSKAHGRTLGLDEGRVYGSYEEMADAEAARDDGIDFATVVTPNHLHYPVARRFIEGGFHVVCDKPMTMTVEQAEDLCRLVEEKDVVFALTHNSTGYPLIKHARAMVEDGRLGTLRKVVAEYSQGWLATPLEQEGSKQAAWRTNPALAGAGALGDIGSHAENLARYVTGLDIDRLCADVSTFVEGRRVDDDANLLLHFEDGAKGVLHCSQVAVGEENDLTLRVYGTEGSIAWRQEEPNALRFRTLDGNERVFRRGSEDLAPAARHATRLPSGHPEAFIEAFANVYANAIRTMRARIAGEEPDPLDLDFPTVQDGAVGVHFIQTALRSGREGGWV